MKTEQTLIFSEQNHTDGAASLAPKDLMLQEIAKLDAALTENGNEIPGFVKILELMLSAGEVIAFSKDGLPHNQFRISLDKDYQFEAFGPYGTTVYIPQHLHVELLIDTLEVRFPGNTSENITGPYGCRYMLWGYVDKISIEGATYTQTLTAIGGIKKDETNSIEEKMEEWTARVERFLNPPEQPKSSWRLW